MVALRLSRQSVEALCERVEDFKRTHDVDGGSRFMDIAHNLMFALRIFLDEKASRGMPDLNKNFRKYAKALGVYLDVLGHCDRDTMRRETQEIEGCLPLFCKRNSYHVDYPFELQSYVRKRAS